MILNALLLLKPVKRKSYTLCLSWRVAVMRMLFGSGYDKAWMDYTAMAKIVDIPKMLEAKMRCS